MERDDYEVDYEMDYGAAAATGGDLTDHAPPPDSHHTQFLDLTNGEGGERHAFDSDHEQLQPVEGQEAHYEEDDEEEDLAAAADDGGYHPRPSLPSNAHANPNPNTPGKVVEAGHEHTGRWTKEEHEDFLEALQLHGKEWKKVAAKVKTRTVVQTRTHAQKYFQKLQKVQEETPGGVDVDQVDMGINADSKKPPSAKKQRPIAPKPSRRSSSTTLSAAQVMANFSSQRDVVPIFAMGSTPVAAHGFGPLTDMKITAPDPMSSMAKGKFPEPSPAATGKRKLAEIAAARMLAGVAGVSLLSREDAPTPPPSEDLAGPPPPPLLMSSAHPARKGLSLQIVNPDSLGISFEKRRRTGETSPVTPWDGQMEALLNEKAKASTTAKPSPMGSTTSESPHPTPATTLHPVCGPSDAYGRSPLHQAVCSMDIESLQDLLEAVGHTLSQWDEAGYAPLHTACALRMNHPDHAVAAMELAKLLLKAGADANVLDQQGNSALHWAARAGDREVAEMLLLKNVPLDGRNQDGESPLHWGMRAGLAAADAVGLLLDNGARAAALSKSFRRPVDVGAEGFLDEETSVVALRARDSRSQHKKLSKELKAALKGKNMEMRESRKLFLSNSAHSRTLVLHHPECLEHVPKSKSDWEAPDRVVTILEQLAAGMEANAVRPMVYNHEVAISTDFERAKLDLLSRVHGAEYLSFVHDLSKDLERKVKGAREDSDDSPAPVVPFTPMVQRSMIKIKEAEVKLHSNSDTAFSAGSLKAARRAAGAVQHAVDCVLIGRNRNAFCVVRPPGHHAGVNGLLDGGESCGFCIFNNVAAGALYAVQEERELCNRCAIVDIDVHHGNGTEEIVRKFSDPSKLFFFSIHLYDNDNRKRSANQFHYKFYPGTGSEDDLALNIMNVPIVPLWREHNASTAPAARTHNTRHKAKTNDPPDDSSSAETPRGSAKNSDAEAGSGSATPQLGPASSGRVAYRQAIQDRLLPALRAFNPDLIMISAGFDAARGDVGNARHERGGRERMGIDLEPEDYAWTTRKILEIADICCQGRVVSVLEGGYGRSAPPLAETPNQAGLDRSVLADSAMRHLHALIDPYDTEHRFTTS